MVCKLSMFPLPKFPNSEVRAAAAAAERTGWAGELFGCAGVVKYEFHVVIPIMLRMYVIGLTSV